MRHGLALVGFAAVLSTAMADDPPKATPPAESFLDLKAGTELVTRINYGGEKLAKPFLWPLLAPGGVPVTRAWPMDETGAKSKDHVHQKSGWFCHGDVIPEGIELKQKVKGVEGVDLWSETPGHGWIETRGHGDGKANGQPFSVLYNSWQTAEREVFLGEGEVYEIHDRGDARLIVAKITLDAEFCPVTFGDTKEGSFGVRVSDQIAALTGKGTITNADGKTGEKDCWGFVSKWCDYSGSVDGKPAGIAIFDGPKNKYPACWHVRAYGLMAANPFGRAKSGFPAMKGRTDLVKLAKSEKLELRYGILLHTGDVTTGKVAEHYEYFAKLP